MLKYLICENCHEVIASFDPEKIQVPISGKDFQTKWAPDREMLPPWLPVVEPQWMWCPICKKRPFHDPNPKRLRVSNCREGLDPHWHEIVQPRANGEVEKTEENAENDTCPKCGKKRQKNWNAYNFETHIKYCKGVTPTDAK